MNKIDLKSFLPDRKSNIEYILILFFGWIALYSWRVFYLGYYSDDWSLYVEPQLTATWRNIMNLLREHADRPVYAFLRYLIIVTWNGSTWMLHLICGLIMLLSSFCVYYSNLKVIRWITSSKNDTLLKLSAALSSLLWLTVPWGLGYSLWPSGVIGVWATIFWCGCVFFMFEYLEKNNKKYIFISSACLSLSYITYQAYFGAWVVLVLIILCKKPQKQLFTKASFVAMLFFVVQISVGLFTYLFTPKHSNPIGKGVKMWLATLFHLPKNLTNIVCDNNAAVFLATLSCFLCLLVIFIFKLHKLNLFKNAIYFFVLCNLGIVINILLYSLASYGYDVRGTSSRVFQGVSFWICIYFAFVFTILFHPIIFNHYFKKIPHFLITAFFVLLMYRNVMLSNDWIEHWKKQNEILSQAPVSCFNNLSEPAAILLKEPQNTNGQYCFDGNWDLSSALRVYYYHDAAVSKKIKYIYFAPYLSYRDIIPRTGPDAFSDIRIWDSASGKVTANILQH